MERLLLVWDELDDWAGIVRHYAGGVADRFNLQSPPAETLSALLTLLTVVAK
jgi:hypothetical protein